MTSTTRQLWDQHAAEFDKEADHGLTEPATRQTWQDLLLPLLARPSSAVADLGCGTGSLSLLFAEAGHRVHGVDFSPKMLDRARAKTHAVTPRPEFIEGDAASPPLPSESYDAVVSRHVLWAMPDPATALRSWQKLLRPNGQLILIEGRWSTGAGLTAVDCASLLRELGGEVDIHNLTDPQLWGGPINDERYLAISRPEHADGRDRQEQPAAPSRRP
jgi:SAM-dependent methyltransferase